MAHRLLRPLFLVSLAFFTLLAFLIIPLRQKIISWPSVRNLTSDISSISSNMMLPTFQLRDGNAIPVVSVNRVSRCRQF
jgi:signal peptidase I